MNVDVTTVSAGDLRKLLDYLNSGEYYFRYDEDKEQCITHLRNMIRDKDLMELMEPIAKQFVEERGVSF